MRNSSIVGPSRYTEQPSACSTVCWKSLLQVARTRSALTTVSMVAVVYHFLPARNQTQRLCKDCEGWWLGHDLVTWPPVAQGRDLCVLVEVAGTKLNQEHQEPW